MDKARLQAVMFYKSLSLLPDPSKIVITRLRGTKINIGEQKKKKNHAFFFFFLRRVRLDGASYRLS